MAQMVFRGIADLLPFLNVLYERGRAYDVVHCHPDSILVTVQLADVKVEVDFFDDRVDFSVFERAGATRVSGDDLIGLLGDRGR